MNPYIQLAKVARVFSQRATLTKQAGTVLTLFVKPEKRESERIGAAVPAALTTRDWSCNASDFGDESNFPTAGDVLTVYAENGAPVSYDVARDAQTGRYWEQRYLRNGYRVKFTTKFNPKEVQS